MATTLAYYGTVLITSFKSFQLNIKIKIDKKFESKGFKSLIGSKISLYYLNIMAMKF
jgi:hypothetical protein